MTEKQVFLGICVLVLLGCMVILAVITIFPQDANEMCSQELGIPVKLVGRIVVVIAFAALVMCFAAAKPPGPKT